MTMSELAQFKEVHTVVLPSFNNDVCKEAAAIDGGESRSE